ncbi:Protein MLS-1, partial [Aphelenchoides avenae]
AAIHSALQKVQLRLEGAELWRKFHALGTEMIVTKSGRRMFPTLQFSVTGLSEDVSYSFMVDFACTDHKRYRYSFHQSKWVVAGPGEVELPSRSHLHCDSPALGSHWMKNFISFDKIKLTNNQLDQNGHVIVNSMHRYMPRVHVVVNRNGSATEIAGTRTFTFRETSFMAVTAYQNHRIESNPFAKGFRECELDDLSTLATSSQFGLPYSALYPLFFPLLFSQPPA